MVPAHDIIRRIRARRGGFTLAELLIVMMIILVLVGILVPTIDAARKKVMVNLTRTIINQIEGGVQSYRNDWQVFPPSGPSGNDAARGAKAVDGTGGQWLVRCLAKSTPADATANAKTKWLGPYGGTETLKQSGSCFADSFGNAILYYRYDKDKNGNWKYWTGDGAMTGYAAGIDAYAKDSTGRYRRTDFALVSMGPNAQFDDPALTTCDDVTNLFSN